MSNDKTMKKISLWSALALLVITLGMTSCDSSKDSKSEETTETVAASDILEVDALLNNPEEYVQQTVTVEGVCTHICKHGGGKIFLMGSDDTKSLRVEAGEAIGSFPQECVHSIVRVTGVLVEDRIDEAYLSQWEARVAEQASAEHGTGEEGGCAADMKANAESAAGSIAERIANFRARIAERSEREGKAYVSLYHMEGKTFEIL